MVSNTIRSIQVFQKNEIGKSKSRSPRYRMPIMAHFLWRHNQTRLISQDLLQILPLSVSLSPTITVPLTMATLLIKYDRGTILWRRIYIPILRLQEHRARRLDIQSTIYGC
ncbi:hypothetical protein BJX66DRAFT_311733 [Aspergillus keveii]|uniref:Uncharacterized protein n=1 Tax=Aspergillus keveii TaxID=714993 RepID=A0ABR4FV34_9EURO